MPLTVQTEACIAATPNASKTEAGLNFRTRPITNTIISQKRYKQTVKVLKSSKNQTVNKRIDSWKIVKAQVGQGPLL